jgi:2-succinyl-5-enolpyruvyl-6-hydroxy-3-cyclohexene-1-carboxylate synthase
MSDDGLTSYVSAFVDELARANVKHVVVSPGSRSTPLALLFAAHEDIRVWINIDERSAAFFALGIAKATKEPVALVCTSGTAAANYLPAVVEAKLSRVPLLVLTADRPHELRDVGAPQAIDQLGLYGTHVKWFVEMALPEASDPQLRYVRTVANRAVSTAASGAKGPVHLNFPFREPLVPNFESQSLWQGASRGDKDRFVSVTPSIQTIEDSEALKIAAILKTAERGIIVCGSMDEEQPAQELLALAKVLQFPILADPLSQLRSGHHSKSWIIDAYDTFLRDKDIADSLVPDVIIRFGAMPISKTLMNFMKQEAISQLVIDVDTGWREPTLTAMHVIRAYPKEFCEKVMPHLGADDRTHRFMERWQNINQITKETLHALIDKASFFEGKVIPSIVHTLTDNTLLFVGNSMPIRDVDSFFFNVDEKKIPIFANRGANGIDGIVSSALGVSAVKNPVVLLLGDLTFFHDLNGLLAAKMHKLNLTIVLINNDGGGIFSFLPQAKEAPYFEELFGTPTGLEFEHAVHLYGGHYVRIESWEQFKKELTVSIDTSGLHVLEINTNRQENVQVHKDVWQKALEQIKAVIPMLDS